MVMFLDFVTSSYYLWFLPIVFLLTFTIGSKKRRRQIGILMASSYVFFWLASGWHIILLITSTLLSIGLQVSVFMNQMIKGFERDG